MNQRGARVRWADSSLYRWVVSLASVLAVLVTNNWCFIFIPAGIAALLLDFVACGVVGRLIPRLALGAVVGVAVGIAWGVEPDWALQEVFGCEPPARIRNVRIQRHYIGGPGEHVLIIEFVADAAAFQALTSLHTPKDRSGRVERWRAAGGDWSATWEAFAGPCATRFARSSWMKIQPLTGMDVFDYGTLPRSVDSLILFHEPKTGRYVALHVRS